MFPGQPAGAPGVERTLLPRRPRPLRHRELRLYLAGFFGYDFLFDKNAGGGVKLRDKGGDFNLSKGGALGVNFDRHWGVEVQMLETPLNLRTNEIDKIARWTSRPSCPRCAAAARSWTGGWSRSSPRARGWRYLIVNDPARRRRGAERTGGARLVRLPKWDPQSPRIVGSVGAGVEYFLNHHLSVGLYMPFHLYQTSDTTVRYRRTASTERGGRLLRLPDPAAAQSLPLSQT